MSVLLTQWLALADITDGIRSTFFGGNTGGRDADAALLWCRYWVEASRTLALG